MKPRMSVARCCCLKGPPEPGPPQKMTVNWDDWNYDETNLEWIDSYAAARGVLGRFDQEDLPIGAPNFPGTVTMRRNASGSVDLSSLGLSSGSPIISAIITLRQGNVLDFGTENFIGDADIQDEDNPPNVATYTAQQVSLWNVAPGGPIAYTLGPTYGASTTINVTSLVQHVIDRPGFAGQNMNIRITTRTNQPINGPSSDAYGAGIVAITQDINDSYIDFTLPA